MKTIIKEDAARIATALGDSIHRLEDTTLLVTGGAGFLCGYLVDVLAKAAQQLIPPSTADRTVGTVKTTERPW